MPEELKLPPLPCPACREPTLQIVRGDDGSYAVACPHCCMRGPEAGGPTWATEGWNSLPRRPRWTTEPPTHAEELWYYSHSDISR